MDKNKKKRIRRYISWVCIVLVVVLLAVLPLIAGGSDEDDGPVASILSGTVEKRTIDSQLVGGGTLIQEDSENVTIPTAVKLTKLLVSNGDTVSAGDAIAEVDRVSVMTAITQVQETLEYLAEEIEAVSDKNISTSVTAQAGGIVKAVYAQAGDSVRDVMLEHGALAVLSLDGLMAVQVERKTDLAAGDTVCVTLDDGTEVDGQVESNLEGVLTVTISDDGYAVGETVKVTTEDGDRIGSGTLYIHSQWNATAYSGTVASVRVTEGKTISAGTKLMTLEDTGITAEYQALSNQHREYEELMLELFQMYQTKLLCAPCDGVVSGIDENNANLLFAESSGWTLTFLTNAPNGDDETGYHNYVGCVKEVGVDGLILNMNPQDLEIADYMDLSGVPLDPAAMTEEVIYTAQAPIYELVSGQWVQISADQISAGDVLLFAGDDAGNFVWVVRVSANTQTEEQPTEPTAPTEEPESTEPSEPETPDNPEGSQQTPEQSEQSGTASRPSGSAQQDMAGFGSTTQEEETYELYGLDTVTIASVTPQNQMTVQITVDEQDITQLFLGQEAKITVEALSGESFEAVVSQIGNTGTSEGGSSKFTVELTLERAENMLPGMTASAYLTLDSASDVCTIPVAALCEAGTEVYVYTTYDAEKEALGNPVAVTVGVSNGEYAQILSGLDEGAEFYYAYYDTLQISDTSAAGGGFSFNFGFGSGSGSGSRRK